ncbi:MAG: hypothetical protein AB2A00_36400 [Myxococcota bacterium]
MEVTVRRLEGTTATGSLITVAPREPLHPGQEYMLVRGPGYPLTFVAEERASTASSDALRVAGVYLVSDPNNTSQCEWSTPFLHVDIVGASDAEQQAAYLIWVWRRGEVPTSTPSVIYSGNPAPVCGELKPAPCNVHGVDVGESDASWCARVAVEHANGELLLLPGEWCSVGVTTCELSPDATEPLPPTTNPRPDTACTCSTTAHASPGWDNVAGSGVVRGGVSPKSTCTRRDAHGLPSAGHGLTCRRPARRTFTLLWWTALDGAHPSVQ